MLSERRRTALIAVALLVLAVPWRVIALGDLSFHGDEETSALPARSLANGNGPRLPTGIEYRRALPLTILNALSARILGKDREVSYRLPAAILGAVTIPLLYLVGRTFVGGPAAALAAGLFALSEWHLAYSRQARMYAPFLLFFILAAWAVWQWASGDDRRRAKWTAAVSVVAVPMFHTLGLLAALFAILPLALARTSNRAAWKLIGFAVVAVGVGYVYTEFYVMAAYTLPTNPPDPLTAVSEATRVPSETGPGWFTFWNMFRTAVGIALGSWLAVRARFLDAGAGALLRLLALFAVGAGTGAMVCLGHLYGAGLAFLLLLLLQPDPRVQLFRCMGVPVGVLGAVALVQTLWAVHLHGVVEGIKSLVTFPFPYPVFLAEISLGVSGLFGVTVLWLALKQPTRPEYGVRACTFAVLLPLAGLGLVSSWGATRYILPMYPFLVLVASYGLITACRAAAPRLPFDEPRVVYGSVALIVATGILGGHGLPQSLRAVTLKHGQPVNELVYTFPFRPDHKNPGEFLRRARGPSDVLIAEDPLQQFWYAGVPIDYWFRSFSDSRQFVYQANDGHLRDIYVNSQLLLQVTEIDSLMRTTSGRVWFVTSGETFANRQLYLDASQRTWLDSLESARAPVTTGLDRVTKVYCLNCPAAPPD